MRAEATDFLLQGNAPKYIVGGRALVFPCIQTIQRLPLNTMTLEVRTNRVYTAQGVPLTVIGTAQVKINGANEEMLTFAAEQFGGERINFIQRNNLVTYIILKL